MRSGEGDLYSEARRYATLPPPRICSLRLAIPCLAAAAVAQRCCDFAAPGDLLVFPGEERMQKCAFTDPRFAAWPQLCWRFQKRRPLASLHKKGRDRSLWTSHTSLLLSFLSFLTFSGALNSRRPFTLPF